MHKKLHLFVLTMGLFSQVHFIRTDEITTLPVDPCEYVREKLSRTFDVSVNIPGDGYITDGYTSALLKKFEECMQQKKNESLHFHHAQSQQLLTQLQGLYREFDCYCSAIDKLDSKLKKIQTVVHSSTDEQNKSELQKSYSALSKKRNDAFAALLQQKEKMATAYQDCEQYIQQHGLDDLNQNLTATLQGLAEHDKHKAFVDQCIDERMNS